MAVSVASQGSRTETPMRWHSTCGDSSRTTVSSLARGADRMTAFLAGGIRARMTMLLPEKSA